MAIILPKALQAGDEVRVVAPARSMAVMTQNARAFALERMQGELGLKVTFGKHVEERDRDFSSAIESRLADLHEAFADKNVKAVMPVFGGFNSVELLGGVDFGLIRRNPKIICGYSDVTTLVNAIYARTGLVTFSGPRYSNFGMKRGFEYTMEHFKKAVMGTVRHKVHPSANWSNDSWYKDQDKREFIANQGSISLKLGKAKGTIVGGNLCSLALLQGTSNMPKLDGSILFLEEAEDNAEVTRMFFLRQLSSLFQLPGAEKIRGIVFGRFEKNTKITVEDLKESIARSKAVSKLNIPIIAGADFGHTTPCFTFGIGGTAEINASTSGSSITFEPFVKA